MKVKLILGEYAYLYRGNLELDEIHNFIKSKTQYSVIIKWKCLDQEMIRISRPSDLKQCIDITSEQSQTIRLYIQECLPNFLQVNQKQQFQQQQYNQQSLIQSNIQQIQSSNQDYRQIPELTKTITFSEPFSADNNDNNQPFNDQQEKQKYFQKTASTVLEEVYSGLQFDYDDINEKNKLEQKQKIQQKQEMQFGQIDQQPQRKMESRQNTEKMTPQWNQKLQDDGFVQENLHNEKLDEKSNSDTVLSSGQNENQGDFYYCDYCSEQIENQEGYKCQEQECQDIHYCKQCFDKSNQQLHEHALDKLEK